MSEVNEIVHPDIIGQYTIEESLNYASYKVHNTKIVMVGYNKEAFYFYVNGKKVLSRSPGTCLYGEYEFLRIACCDKYFAVTYWDCIDRQIRSTTLLLDYSGNLIWLNEEYPSSNIEYADIDIKDKYGLIVAYYGKLMWYRFDGTIKICNIETDKCNRAKSNSCVRWTSSGNIVLAQDDYIRIYKLTETVESATPQNNFITQIGTIPYKSLYEKYDNNGGTFILSKLNIDFDDDTIYYCCGAIVYRRKLYGPIISSHVAMGSTFYALHTNNGLFWTWCEIKLQVVKLLSITSDNISKWTEYINEEERKQRIAELDDCNIS